MQFKSVFDIIGPVMIGPSSSHTAGANRIGRVARKLFGRLPETVQVTLYGSFAKTYKGHGTDLAIISGILDFDTADERIPEALNIARDMGLDVTFIQSDEDMEHPNTARIVLRDKQGAWKSLGSRLAEAAWKSGKSASLTTHRPVKLRPCLSSMKINTEL